MIDFRKIELAHNLAKETESLYFSIGLGMDEGVIALFDANKREQLIFETECIDELIGKLKELTPPKCKCGNPLIQDRNVCDECVRRAVKPQYKIGDKFFLLDLMNEIQKAEVIKVNGNIDLCGAISYKIKYENGCVTTCWEKGIFPSKQALIEAQIQYWQSMPDEPQYCGVSGVKLGKSLSNSDVNLANKEPQYCGVSGVKLGVEDYKS